MESSQCDDRAQVELGPPTGLANVEGFIFGSLRIGLRADLSLEIRTLPQPTIDEIVERA